MRTCPYCLSNIYHSDRKRELAADETLREFLEPDPADFPPETSDESYIDEKGVLNETLSDWNKATSNETPVNLDN